MSYQTHLEGEFVLDEPLTAMQVMQLGAFSNERHDDTKYPGIWCQWIASDDGTVIKWDEGDNFRDYVEWLEFIVANFLIPWGRSISGSVEWSGEENGDLGMIFVKDNKIEAVCADVSHGKPSWEKQ